MATYAEANAQLVAAPKKKVYVQAFICVNSWFYNLMAIANNFPFFMKLAENLWERALVSEP